MRRRSAMNYERVGRTRIMTFVVVRPDQRILRRQVFDHHWRRDRDSALVELSPEFQWAPDRTEFIGQFKGADRSCWVASKAHDPRPSNHQAQRLSGWNTAFGTLRGDLVIEMKRRHWLTYWFDCTDDVISEVVSDLSLSRVAVLPTRLMTHGCRAAAVDEKTMAKLLTAIP